MSTQVDQNQIELFQNIIGMLDVLRAQGFPEKYWPSFAILRASAIQHINELEKSVK